MDTLLEKGADINFIASAQTLFRTSTKRSENSTHGDSFKGTALHLAANWGLEDVVKWLLAKGARADPKDSDGNYAMQRAEQEDQLEVRDLILRAFEKESKEN